MNKQSYFYDVSNPLWNRSPYVSLFIKTYNDKYTNSFCVTDEYYKNDLKQENQKSIYVFYNSKDVTEDVIKNQLGNTKNQILQNLQTLIQTVRIENV
jgi:hypothetical protein